MDLMSTRKFYMQSLLGTISVRFFYCLFVEDQLAVLETGGDVEIIFEQETCLEENLDREVLKIF